MTRLKGSFSFFNSPPSPSSRNLLTFAAMEMFANVKVIAFDADDTLWDCQS